MTTYYIDGATGSSGDGSWGSPWKVLSDANGVAADSTVYVRGAHDAFDGEYVVGNSSNNRWVPSNSGGSGTEITLMNYNDEDVWVVGSAQVTGWASVSGNVYRAELTTEPTPDGVYINWRTLERVGSAGAVDAVGEYWWGDVGGTDYLYCYDWESVDLTDEETNVVRYSLKGRYVDTGTEDYIIIDGINFGAFGGDKAQCIYTESAGSHRTIRNLSVKGGRGTTSGAHGIHIKGDDELIDNCTVMYCGAYGYAGTSNDGNGIHLETNNGSSRGNDCIIRDCRVAYCDHGGIRVDDEGSSGGQDVNTTIVGNYVSNMMGTGIQISDVTNITMEFNIVDSCGEHTLEPRGNITFGSSSGDTHNLIFTIRYNIISNGGSDSQVTGGEGIQLAFEGGNIYDIKIYNNTFYQNRRYAIDLVYDRLETTFEIVGNIFYNNNTTEGGNGEVQVYLSNSTNCDVTNADYNIFYSEASGIDYWLYKGTWRSLATMYSSYSLEEHSATHQTTFQDATNLNFRPTSPQVQIIDIMSTHPISGWDSSPGSYPASADWKWDSVHSDYALLSGQSTKQNDSFDAGAYEVSSLYLAFVCYNSFKAKIMDGTMDLDTHIIKVALAGSGYTPDIDAHDEWADVVGNEVTGTGYTAGGKALEGKTVSADTTDDEGVFDADDTTWSSSTITAQYAIVYDDTATNDDLIGYIDFLEEKVSISDDFTIQWNSEGIINLG